MKEILIKSFRKNALSIISVLFYLLVVSGISVLMPVMLQKFIDAYFDQSEIVNSFLVFATAYVLFGLIKKGMIILYQYQNKRADWNIFTEVRMLILDKMLTYDDKFYKRYSYGQLSEYTERDVLTISSFCTGVFLNALLNIFVFVGVIFTLFRENVIIGSLFTVYLTVSFIFLYIRINKKSYVLNDSVRTTTETLGKYSEWISAHKDLNLLKGGLIYVKEKFQSQNIKLKRDTLLSQDYLYKIWTFTLLISLTANVLFLMVSGIFYFKGLLTLGTVYLVYTYSTTIKSPIENFQSDLRSYLRARTAFKRLNEIMLYKPEIVSGERMVPDDIQRLEIKNLYFRYLETDKWVQENLNITCTQSSVIGIKGESGVGKSTFCKLLINSLKPISGQILVNGVNISEFKLNEYRRFVSYFQADAYLLDTTVKNNILLYKDVSTEEMLKKINEYKLSDLFNVFDKRFLESSVRDLMLSEGQKQMINVMRSIFSDSKILIFDEASSVLDEKVRRCITQLIEKLKAGRIIFVISHHDGDLSFCDSVFDFAKAIKE